MTFPIFESPKVSHRLLFFYFSSKGEESNFIAAGGEDGSASFWDVRNPTVPVYRYNKHRKPVRRYFVTLICVHTAVVQSDIMLCPLNPCIRNGIRND